MGQVFNILRKSSSEKGRRVCVALVFISREERESASSTLKRETNVDNCICLMIKLNQNKPSNMNKPSLHFNISLKVAPGHLSRARNPVELEFSSISTNMDQQTKP